MTAVGVVQVAGDTVIHVVSVRHRLVAAAGTVHMTRLMPTAAMVGGTPVGMITRYFDHVLVDMPFVRVMEVTIVQIIDMAAVAHRGMAAARSMLMRMVGMGGGRAIRHGISSFPYPGSADTAVRLSAAWVDSIANQLQHVLVGQCVEDVLGFAPPPHQTHHRQGLQSRRHGGDLLALVFGQLRHARFAIAETQQKPQPLRVTESGEDVGRNLYLRPRWKRHRRTGWMATMRALPVHHSLFHRSMDCKIDWLPLRYKIARFDGLSRPRPRADFMQITLVIACVERRLRGIKAGSGRQP
jgi:hypothetical protein